MTNIVDRLSSLSPERQALVQKLIQQQKSKALPTTILPQPRGKQALPLSFAQERLWFIHQLDPQNAAYNVPAAYWLYGQLDVMALKHSLDALIRRHEVLRTQFVSVEGRPLQQILSSWQLNISVIDLSGYSADEERQIVDCCIEEEATHPFNLAQDLPIRAKILRLKEGHILLVTLHHIVSDTWSSRIAARDIQAFYQIYGRYESPTLPSLPIQYADYAVWQRQWLQGERLERLLTFWRETLAGATHTLELPTDYPRSSSLSSHGSRHHFTLSKDLTILLKHLSQQQEVTLFMLLLAAYQVLLFRYTGQEDFLIGSPISNRNRPEIAELIGYFANTLAFRADLRGNPSFITLLHRVRNICLSAYEHEELPLAQLIEAIQVERSLDRHPLFQVTFSLQSANFGLLTLPGLTIQPIPVESSTTKFDLTLSLVEESTHLAGYFEYNVDLFAAETIARLTAHWQQLLTTVVLNPEQKVANLSLFTEQEYNQFVFDWNVTPEITSPATGIHQLFQAQAVCSPDNQAIVALGETAQFTSSLTYQELDHYANQLAHYLQTLGVCPDTRVGVCMERSTDVFVAILGILKAGGAYVPLDPAYPLERLAFMINDSQAQIVLTQHALQTSLSIGGTQAVCLDRDWPVIASYPTTPPLERITAVNLAYIIYTSGSTGQPKGVSVTHQNLIHSTQARLAYYQEPIQRFLLLSSLAFDSSLAGVFGSLCGGGTLYLPTSEQQRDVKQLINFITKYRITHTLCLPALYALMLAESDPPQLTSLTTVIVAGEACTPELVQQHQLQLPQNKLFNEYGPTEATVWSSVYACRVDEVIKTGTVPIGKPIPNMNLYILDNQLQPVPIGVAGELYIAGIGLARGYHQRPGVTAEKFLPHPFSRQPGDRLYKTGDLVRYQSDGQIQFLGRVDHQMKIRGFRIEIREIEIVLEQHPQVQQAVVVGHEGKLGERKLTGYVTYTEAHPISQLQLRSFLQQRLPAYMIPAHFVCLPALPLLPNGKVNRRALPPPDRTNRQGSDTAAPPQTVIEQKLHNIWTELLEQKQIGIYDNFFELGGHSLLATQLASRICRTFQLELPLKAIFETPTIAGLAESIKLIQSLTYHFSASMQSANDDREEGEV